MSDAPTRGATNSAINSEELESIIDAILSDHHDLLKDLLSEKRRYDGKTFQAELAGFISTTLADHGYCWARIPADHDDLWHGLKLTVYDVGRVSTLAMTSHNEHVRRSAARDFSTKIMKHWRETRTAVVKRRVGG